MITELTPEQEKQMDELAELAIKRANSGDTSIDTVKAQQFIDFLYETSDVEMVICDSPEALFTEAAKRGYKKQKGETFDYIGLGFDSGWTTFYQFMEQIGVDFSDIKEWDKWKLLLDTGIWATLLFEEVAFVCRRPSIVRLNSNHDLHCTTGMAIQWLDGTGYYFLNGVAMEEEHVLTPAEKLDVKKALKEKNVEVRRELIRKIGIERFISNSKAKVLDAKGDYELLSVFLSDEVPDARYLKMKNPSIGVYHVEGVEGNTVQDALDFRAARILTKGIRWEPSKLS